MQSVWPQRLTSESLMDLDRDVLGSKEDIVQQLKDATRIFFINTSIVHYLHTVSFTFSLWHLSLAVIPNSYVLSLAFC